MPAGVFNARTVRNSDGVKPKCDAVDVDLDLRRADVFKQELYTWHFSCAKYIPKLGSRGQ